MNTFVSLFGIEASWDFLVFFLWFEYRQVILVSINVYLTQATRYNIPTCLPSSLPRTFSVYMSLSLRFILSLSWHKILQSHILKKTQPSPFTKPLLPHNLLNYTKNS